MSHAIKICAYGFVHTIVYVQIIQDTYDKAKKSCKPTIFASRPVRTTWPAYIKRNRFENLNANVRPPTTDSIRSFLRRWYVRCDVLSNDVAFSFFWLTFDRSCLKCTPVAHRKGWTQDPDPLP